MPQSANPTLPLPEAQHRPVLALAIRFFAGLALATMLMLVKLGKTRGIDLPHMLLARQALTIPILLGWLAMRGKLHIMRTDRIGSHAFRAGTGTIGMVLNFAAPTLLPLAVATTLSFTSPMFAVVLSALLLREHVGKWRWLAATLGFVGVALVADPFHATVPMFGALVAIGGAFMVALISIQIRDLTKTEDSVAIVTWFAIFGTPVLFIVSLFYDWNVDAGDILVLLGIGVSGVAGQLLLTASLRFGPVSTVIIMDYMALIWATTYGWLIFENLPPASLWLGAPIVILAGGIIVWREQKLAKQRNEAAAR
ncbi:DMT family transporter [Croceicoccus gelatinilyticus]|uniref:DMT family transporter n=1 Tax=Croceicoccus gelatinilyticus TaxID=2835536 RepID=UPI001BCD541B|nr:DMT family transporter [Croceicoccus gelatinilyticus]MBS7668470.1 DMT family transporter [Croceicoccus gelatinilyticus]